MALLLATWSCCPGLLFAFAGESSGACPKRTALLSYRSTGKAGNAAILQEQLGDSSPMGATFKVATRKLLSPCVRGEGLWHRRKRKNPVLLAALPATPAPQFG